MTTAKTPSRHKIPEYLALVLIAGLFRVVGWVWVIAVSGTLIVQFLVKAGESPKSFADQGVWGALVAVGVLGSAALPGFAMAASGEALAALRDIARNSFKR